MTDDPSAVIEDTVAMPAAEVVLADHQESVPHTVRVRMLGDSLEAASDRLMRLLSRLESRSGPLILGPWLGEVGFEMLYWIPFIRWVHANFPGMQGRLIAVTRGGVQSW